MIRAAIRTDDQRGTASQQVGFQFTNCAIGAQRDAACPMCRRDDRQCQFRPVGQYQRDAIALPEPVGMQRRPEVVNAKVAHAVVRQWRTTVDRCQCGYARWLFGAGRSRSRRVRRGYGRAERGEERQDGGGDVPTDDFAGRLEEVPTRCEERYVILFAIVVVVVDAARSSDVVASVHRRLGGTFQAILLGRHTSVEHTPSSCLRRAAR